MSRLKQGTVSTLVEKRSLGPDSDGVFTRVAIPAGTPIIARWNEDFYDGMEGWRRLSPGEILQLPQTQQELFFRYGLDLDFGCIVGPLGAEYVVSIDNFINHSCAPNLGYDEDGNVVALDDLPPDRELLIDYGTFTVNFDESFACGCGAPNCRVKISRDDWKRLARQSNYGFPKFLRPRIVELL